MLTNCLQKSFTLQNSLSTVSLGKLGEDGGEEGLDVEEEWRRDSTQTWTICLIVKLVFVQINMCVFLLPVKDVNKFNIYLYSLVSNGKTANRKKTDKRHPYWLRPESTGFLIRKMNSRPGNNLVGCKGRKPTTWSASYKLTNEQLISSTLSHEEKFNTKVSRWH